MTEGKVVDYGYRGNGVIVPVVEYHVLGETYKKVRTFRGYIMKSWRRDGEPYVRVTKMIVYPLQVAEWEKVMHRICGH